MAEHESLESPLRSVRILRERLWNDPHRPRYHLLPPDGFFNDSNGTIFWPDFQELTGQNIRMVWNDLQSWHWEGLQIPGGTVRTFPFALRKGVLRLHIERNRVFQR